MCGGLVELRVGLVERWSGIVVRPPTVPLGHETYRAKKNPAADTQRHGGAIGECARHHRGMSGVGDGVPCTVKSIPSPDDCCKLGFCGLGAKQRRPAPEPRCAVERLGQGRQLR
jgi:hypothetical protein